CCASALTTKTSAPNTSPVATRPKPQPGSQTASETSVIKSKSGLPHDNSDSVSRKQLKDSIAAFDARIEAALLPFHDVVERLNEVPGLGPIAVETVIAEIGIDMSQFPSAGHLLSWAGFVPRLDESAGKRRSTRIKKGAPWLKPVLLQSAWGAARKKNSYLQAQFLRLKARRGAKKAAI